MMVPITHVYEICSKTDLTDDGDFYEQKYSELITDRFPNYETYWRYFVVPATQRVEIEDKRNSQRIRRRKGISDNVFNIMGAHYSVFLHLVYSHLHLEKYSEPSSFEGFYVHLGSALDLAEDFIQRVYLLLLDCHGERSEVLQGLSKESFLERASAWYDKKYEHVYEVYLRKGKSDCMRIPCAKNVLDEYYGDSAIWKSYKDLTQQVRTYRNVIVHTMQIGTVMEMGKGGPRRLVPKKEVIQEYKSWPAFFSAVEDLSARTDDFVEDRIQMSADLSNIEYLLNDLWDTPIQDMKCALFEDKNEFLLEQYQFSAD